MPLQGVVPCLWICCWFLLSMLVSVSFSTSFLWSFLHWDYWVTVGEASEELMCMGRGEAEGKPSVGYLSYSISPSMLFTVLNCDVSSATLYFKLGQNRQLRGIKPGTYLKHDPLSSQHISVLNSSCFVSRWGCSAKIHPCLHTYGVQIKLENGYHLLPLTYQWDSPPKNIPSFLLASAYHEFNCSFCCSHITAKKAFCWKRRAMSLGIKGGRLPLFKV